MRILAKLVAGFVLIFAATGCAEVVKGDSDTVHVDTGDLGEIAQGTREWLSYLQAREHCAKYSKSPEIVDLKGPVAIYKCVADK